MHWIHRLVVLDKLGSHEYVLNDSIYSIGHDPECDITLNSRFASRYHATLVQRLHQAGMFGYEIIDGCYQFVNGELIGHPSTNGIFVNGRKQENHYLGSGDEIVLGQVQMFYYLDSRGSLDDIEPPNPNSYTPRKPHPSAPDFGAEVLPEMGLNQVSDIP